MSGNWTDQGLARGFLIASPSDVIVGLLKQSAIIGRAPNAIPCPHPFEGHLTLIA